MSASPDLGSKHLLVVSDLHVGDGRRPRSGRFSRHEDFVFDEEFARFLAYHTDPARGLPGRWHLVIAGDFLEFQEVVSTEGAPKDLLHDPEMKTYGLGSGEREAVYKLGRIVAGHPVLFGSLASFLAAGNVVTIMSGNHDVELHYAGVRAALVRELRGLAPAPFDQRAVRFSEWFVYEAGRLWIEHGHQQEAVNSFRYLYAPLLPTVTRKRWPAARHDDIDLPIGSMFMRYLFNHVEEVEPDADNVKPATRFIALLFRKHPLVALRLALGHGTHFVERLARAWRRLPPGAYDQRRREHEEVLARVARAEGISEATLRALDDARARTVFEAPRGWWKVARLLARTRAALPVLVLLVVTGSFVPLLAAWWLVRLLRRERPSEPDALARHAAEIASRVGVRYVVMGHTHHADLVELQPGGGEYFNTGSWTKAFEEKPDLLHSELQLAFLLGERRADGGLRMRLMEWNDGAGEPRLLKLFGSEAPPVATAASSPAATVASAPAASAPATSRSSAGAP